MPRYYLRIEAVNFDYSVYDTNDISTIRGGSFLILNAFHQLKEKARNKEIPVDVISSAASEAIITFETDESIQQVNQCLKIIQEKIGAFATVVHAVFRVPEKNPPAFQICLEKLRAACRLQQYRQWSFVPPKSYQQTLEGEKVDTLNLNEASNIDGLRPAIQKEGDKTLSYNVRFRREEGKKLRQEIYENILGERPGHLFPDRELSEQPVEFADDLEDLSINREKGKLSGKIAFIYIDGNRFGSVRDHLFKANTSLKAGEKALKAFQTHVQDTMRRTALKAIIKEFNVDNPTFRSEKGNIRLETLLWGGDELELVVPAWLGWKVLKKFFDATREFQTYALSPDRSLLLTHAAGVVFCHYKLPVLQVRKYAHDLCELAKKDIPKKVEEIQDSANRFAFLNMSAFDLIKGDVERFLKTYHASYDMQDLLIQAEEMETFETYLPIIKTDFPRNKLFDLTNALAEGKGDEISDMLERVYATVNPRVKEEIVEAVRELVGDHLHRWFVIADLIDYFGEDS